MMKKIWLVLFVLVTFSIANAQNKTIDSLKNVLGKASADTDRLKIIIKLGNSSFPSNPDSAIVFGQQGYKLAFRIHRQHNLAECADILAVAYSTMGDYPNAMEFFFKARSIFQDLNDVSGVSTENDNIGATYIEQLDYKNALIYLQLANKQWTPYATQHKLVSFNDRTQSEVIDINIAECYLYTHHIDSAERYLQASYNEYKKVPFPDFLENVERDFGEIEIERGNKVDALKHLRKAVSMAVANKNGEMLTIAYLSTAKLYHHFSQPDSAIYYAKKALSIATAGKYQQDVINAGKALYTYYDEQQDMPQAYKYFKLTTAAKDSIYSKEKIKRLISLDFDEKQRQQEIDTAQQKYREQIQKYILIAGVVILLLLAFIFWLNGKQKHKANQLLEQQKADIESAMSQLQITQKQLIQSEKMASLGELTAGIAHEIQNPLNFVNNFSEVNIELIEEMELELNSGDKNEAISIAGDIKANLEKIRHHGKRADGIVKGMLHHSRSGGTVKEMTDVNALADEYLRLAYHGLRAKDKSFNADLVTDFDSKLPQIAILPQEIGRVLLNLYTNAFYAIQHKQQTAGKGYKPTVEVNTSVQKGSIVIKVRDNGMGMPEHIKEKIMQPFFTTKPTGQGTGLGLSMSYDIVVKGHGGNIDVDTKENEYTEFTITIPQ